MQLPTGAPDNNITSSQHASTEGAQWQWEDSTDCPSRASLPISAPVQDFGQQVLVHWDRGIDVRSAGPHIMTILRKIWGAERHLRAKQGTLANRQRSHTTNTSILLQQSLYQTAKWEEILNRYERELDGLVFKRFQLVRVKTQAGKHVPQGAGRVYSKVVGYSLPKADTNTDIEIHNTNTMISPSDALGDSTTQAPSDGLRQSSSITRTVLDEEEQPSMEQSEVEHNFEEKQDGKSKVAAANISGHDQQYTGEGQTGESDDESKDTTAYGYQYTIETQAFDALDQTLEDIKRAECPMEICMICQAQLPKLEDTHPMLENSAIDLNDAQNMCLLCLSDLWDRYGRFANQLVLAPGHVASRSFL